MRKTGRTENSFCAMVTRLSEYELVIQNTYQNPAMYTDFQLTPEGMRAYLGREMEKVRTALDAEHAKGPMTKDTIRQLLNLAQGSPILFNGVQVQLQKAVKPLLNEDEEAFEGRGAEVRHLFVQFYRSREPVTDDLVGTFHRQLVGGESCA